MGTLSPNLGLTIPTIGGDAGPAFAQEINGDLSIIDSIYGGRNVLNVGGNTNVTLTTTQAQNLVQQFTGVLTGSITVFAPAVGAFYAVENATTGAFSLSFGCAGGGNAQVIPQGLSTWLWTDGSFTRLSNPPGWQELATYTASGANFLTIGFPGPFRRFRVNLQSIVPAVSTSTMNLTLSTNGGASYLTTYNYNILATVSGLTTPIVNTIEGTANGLLTAPMAAANNCWDVTFEMFPGSASQPAILKGTGYGVTTVSGPAWCSQFFGISAVTSGLVNVAQIFCTGGTFSGTAIVEGLP